ncbi:hypothetical protein ACOMHN_056583 [Nucella lapillus]
MKMFPRRRTVVLLLFICLCPLLYVVFLHNQVLYSVSRDELSRKGCVQQRILSELTEPSLKRVLLISYGRSGSTFVSYILKENPDTFFFFEPLRAMLLRSTRGLNGVIMSYGNIGLHGDVSKVRRCLVNMLNETYYLNLSHYLQCLLDFWHSCTAASFRLFKVIRLPIRSIYGLMRKYPDLQVVYLVRDPRAILDSQSALFGKAPRPESFCRMVVDDAAHMEILQETFPRRAVAVRYEDIANEPFTYARRLYQALNIPVTDRVEVNIRRMTSASAQMASTKDHYSAFRVDSRKAASVWRTRIKLESLLKDDTACGKAYEWLGYKTVGNLSALRNVDYSLTGSAHRLAFL